MKTREQPIIKTGFCVAYDWRLLENSLPPVYESSDIICLAIDKARRSWAGNSFEFNDAAFYTLIDNIDKDKKIIIYEDDFSRPDLTARENCNLQRTLIAKRMGEGGWHVQVDCDEYFSNFNGFVKFLLSLNDNPTGKEKPYNVNVFLYDLFKKVPDGYLYAYANEKRPFSAPFATTRPQYLRARHNGYFNRVSPFYVIHETWARSEEELRFKLSNWGHSAEELKKVEMRESFINLWKAIDQYNYQYIKNFHFSVAHGWEGLGFVKAKDMQEFIINFNPGFKISGFYLRLLNNRMYGRIRYFIDKMKRTVKS
jgi:hypothetical protein